MPLPRTACACDKVAVVAALFHLLAAETAAEEGKKTVLMMLAVGLVFVAVIAIGELVHSRHRRKH